MMQERPGRRLYGDLMPAPVLQRRKPVRVRVLRKNPRLRLCDGSRAFVRVAFVAAN